MQRLLIIFLFLSSICCHTAHAQPAKDSSVRKSTAGKKNFNPRTATIRSAILPGLGQIYNKKYWKLPLVYGALGTTAGIFVYNVKNYRLLRDGYKYKSDNDPSNDILIAAKFRNLSAEALRSYRNTFRQNIDYSALFFLLFWGLNVVDATVDANLKSFDVSDDLSIRLKAGYSDLAGTNGLSLVIPFSKKHSLK